MFTIFTENNLIFLNQSGFRPGDSCVNQLLAITREIYKLFDEGSEIRGVSLDISKAFDKVWHEDLLNQNGISGNLLNLLHYFLSCQKQRLVLNGLSTRLGIMPLQEFHKVLSWGPYWTSGLGQKGPIK